MADISKITLLDGQEYDIKDAVARAAIPAAATATPQMDGSAAVGTSTKYAKEDHKHPRDTSLISLELTGTELVDGDNLNTIKTPGNYYFTGSGTIKGAPTTSKFKMVVIKTGVSEFGTDIGTPCQILFSNEGSNSLYGTIYYRYHNNGNFWRDWQSIRNPSTVNSHTVLSDVPANAVFTDTTYTPASNAPLMDGTAAVGTSEKYAREDHVHPTDTSLISTGFTGTELVDGNNLAYIQTPGNYYFTGSGTIGGAPTTSKFKMVVIKTGKTEAGTDIGAPCQILFSYEGASSKIYYRYHRSGNLWRDWQSLTNILSNGSRTELPTSGANLNDYKTPGTYSFASNGSITNSPLPDSSYAFTLFVIEGNNTYGHGCSQVIFPIDATVGATFTADVYVRRYSPNASNGGWSDWVNLSSPTTISGHTVQSDVPANAVFTDTTYTPASATPLMDGTAAVGTSEKYAREDHVHPTDTSLFSLGYVGTEIPYNGNLDNYTTPGNYYANSSSAIQNKPSSSDSRFRILSFKMVVVSAYSGSNSSQVYQILLACQDLYANTQENLQIHVRVFDGTYWHPWADIRNPITVNGHTVQSDIPANAIFTDTTYTPASATPLMDGTAAVGTSEKYAREDHVHPRDSKVFSLLQGEEIPENSDLDDYKTPGNYYCGNSANAKQVANSPEESAYKLVVIKLVSASRFYQIALPNSSPPKIYIRYCAGVTWSDWVNIRNAATVNGHTVESDVPANAVFTDTTYTPATAAPDNIASSSSAGTSTNYARQDHTHGITVATGDSDGQVKIAGQNASVKGLKSLAFKDTDDTAMTLNDGTLLNNNDDLNNYNTPGVYRCNTAAKASTISNSPVTNTYYKLFVSKQAYDNNVNQYVVYYENKLKIFYRRSYGSSATSPSWYAWEDLTDVNYLNVSSTRKELYNIPTNSDLNTYTVGGVYYGNLGTNTNVSHLPPVTLDSSTYYLTVYYRTDGAVNKYSGYQLFTVINTTSDIYFRSFSCTNSTGLIWSNWREIGQPASNLAFNGVYYGECSTAAATVAKTVTLTNGDGFSLVEGAKICVRFEYANSASNPTLNVNDTGAKAIVRFGTTVIGTTAGGTGNWSNGGMVLFIYDGTSWVEHYWNNTTYSSMTVAEYTAGTGTTARIITPARLKAAIKLHSAPEVYTATIPTTGWTTASYGAYIDVTFTGATFAADDTVFVDLNLSDDTNLQLINDTWACLLRATPTASSAVIRFKFREIPTVAIPVRAVVK